MFFLAGFISTLIVTVISFLLFSNKKTVAVFIHTLLKYFFAVNSIGFVLLTKVFKYKSFILTENYTTINYIKYFCLATVVGILLMVISALVRKFIIIEHDNRKRKKGAIVCEIISVIIFTLGVTLFYATVWGKKSFGDVMADQLLINLMTPFSDGDTSVYYDFFEDVLLYVVMWTTLFALTVFYRFKINYVKGKKVITIFNDIAKRVICLILSLGILGGGIFYGAKEFHLKQLYYSYVVDSEVFDDLYVDPETADIQFPEKKRNLIHIYLESMENSYLSKDLGGYGDINYMPELTELSYEGFTFSDNDTKFGGPQQATGTTWSVASMVNMTTGLPMKVPGAENSYGSEEGFLPGAYTLGEILEKQGYEQTVMFGASAFFGGLYYYYGTHGNWKIMDYRYAQKYNMIPKDYKVWWGYEDDKLYEFAKDEITRLYNTGKPFNFTMETADTHRPDGYLSPNAPRKYKSQYANVIAYSTEQTVEFVRWIQQQPFYENTTIVLIGDHLSMDTKFFEGWDKNYFRSQYNLILNPAPEVANAPAKRFVNRTYANYDMFPTILASIGAKIDGERLGVGTNLFSSKPTVFEEYGYQYIDREFQKKSEIFNNEIM